MRTTIDVPDELYRTLKTRAALKGVTLRELITELIESSLEPRTNAQRSAGLTSFPVAIPGQGEAINLTPDDIHRIEEEEDLARLGRSS